MNRLTEMTKVITKTYTACNLPIPDKGGMAAKVYVFCEDLEDIPDNELDHCFRQARLNRQDSFFPSTAQVLKAWEQRANEIRREREKNKALPEPSSIEMGRDCANYMSDPTPEKLKRLREKYPNAGF